MGQQHIFSIIFISGVFLGLLHCYPLLGEDSSSSSDLLDGDGIDRIHRNDLQSPRLQRLVQTFVHLVELDKQDLDHFGQGNPSLLKQDAPWEDNNGLDIGQVSDRLARGDLDVDADDDDSRSKRQQGWYTQYGKRDGETTTASGLTGLPEELTISGGSSSEFRRQITERMSSILKDIFNLADEVQRGDGAISQVGDTRDTDEQPADAAAPSAALDKRQQGWYIQYGKRSNPGYASL